jgi:hypothetical protein
MNSIDFRQVVMFLIAVYFIYKFIGRPIIRLIIVMINTIKILKLKRMNEPVIIQIPYHKEMKQNIVEIISMIFLFILIIFIFKSIYAIVIGAGLLTIVFEIITPILYKKINGFYSEYIVFNKIIPYKKIHSWKRIEDKKAISFLGMDGIRFDFVMGKNYSQCISFLNIKELREEI